MALKIKATQRKDLKQSNTKALRKEGQVPAVVYGKEEKANPISVDSIELVKTVRDEGRNAIITLDVEGDSTVDVMLHDYQMHPLKDELIHVDFYVMDMSEEMDVEVPVNIEGEAIGTKEGGIFQQPLYVLQVRAKPRDIPENITIDVSELAIGDNLSIEDLPVSDKYEFTEEPDTVIAVVLPPEEEEEEEETDAGLEPELVGADEDEEEE